MADKFIIHGATFNGDGTSSAEAASDGAAGAWNNINILTGTTPAFGVLAAGDVVYIRSKTSAGANIDVALSTTAETLLGSAAATLTAPIRWVLDGGAVWPGVDGALNFTIASGNYPLTVMANNVVVASRRDAIYYYSPSTGNGYSRGVQLADSAIFGWKIQVSSVDTDYAEPAVRVAVNKSGVAVQCDITATGYAPLVLVNSSSRMTLTDCSLEITSASGPSATQPVIYGSRGGDYNAPAVIDVIGCTINGTIAATKPLAYGLVNLIGCSIPGTMPPTAAPVTSNLWTVSGFGVDGAVGTAARVQYAGVVDSRQDGYYPTLNGVLPDSAGTPWSWKVYPSALLRYGAPTSLTLSAFFTDATTPSTATVEFLEPTTLTVNKENLYVVFTWIDATGAVRSASSYNPAAPAHDVSTAAWSTTTYGPTLFTKRKVSVPLAGGVKRNTLVTAHFMIRLLSASANDVLFVCPVVVLT